MINYGNKKEYMRLLKECSLQALTTISRPGDTKWHYFNCIHCNHDSFSNKQCLNKHRWGALCDVVVDDMGNLKRMLPYLDLGNGKGKVLEMIRKGKDFDIAFKLDLDVK